MREIFNGAVMSVSTRYDGARGKAITEVEMDVDDIEDYVVLEGDRFAGRSGLVGRPVRIVVEVDE